MILTKQDSDQIRISFFKNRIDRIVKIHYPIISDVQRCGSCMVSIEYSAMQCTCVVASKVVFRCL